MRTIVHLSDLHFGALDDAVVEPLLRAVRDAAPDLVAVSGDLTQRARRGQFTQARDFLERLDRPTLVVPGNHDVPLYDVAARFTDPLRRYRRYITANLTPGYRDDEIAVVGVNSARALAFRYGRGRISSEQALRATALLNLAPKGVTRILVTHHPFDLPAGHHEHHLIGGASVAMRWLASAGVDLFLAGHLHVSHVGRTAERYRIEGHSALVVQAGTVSRRARGEPGAFNVVRLAGPLMTIERHSWDADQAGFLPAWTGRYTQTPDGWTPAATEATDSTT